MNFWCALLLLVVCSWQVSSSSSVAVAAAAAGVEKEAAAATGLRGGGRDSAGLSTEINHRSLQTSTKVGTISKLRWINTDTDQPFLVNGIDYLSGRGNFLDDLDFPKVNHTFDAMVDPGSRPVTSVTFETYQHFRTENAAPFAMCGNSGKDYFACNKLEGDIVVTPYNKGVMGTPSVFFVTLVTIKAPPFYFELVNADTDQIIASTSNGSNDNLPLPVINVTQTPNINLVLQWRFTGEKFVWGQPHSVDFEYDNGKYTRYETVVPFLLAGNAGNDYFALPSTLLTPGNHSVTATAYRRANRVAPAIARTTLRVVT